MSWDFENKVDRLIGLLVEGFERDIFEKWLFAQTRLFILNLHDNIGIKFGSIHLTTTAR
jgi:hypothetical protein